LRSGAALKTLVCGRELAKLRLANVLKVKVHEAKTNLSRLLARVETGEEIVILRGDNPVAKLIPAGAAPKTRRAGRLKNQAKLDPSFFDPLPETELKRWEGK
jgi:prevent-host-death family protein